MRRRPQVVVGAGRLGRSGAADAASAGGLPTIARLLKRIFDIVLSASGLVVLAPVLTIIAWRIRTGSSGPALYRQMRGGEKGTTFCIYKFRTMVVDADE